MPDPPVFVRFHGRHGTFTHGPAARPGSGRGRRRGRDGPGRREPGDPRGCRPGPHLPRGRQHPDHGDRGQRAGPVPQRLPGLVRDQHCCAERRRQLRRQRAGSHRRARPDHPGPARAVHDALGPGEELGGRAACPGVHAQREEAVFDHLCRRTCGVHSVGSGSEHLCAHGAELGDGARGRHRDREDHGVGHWSAARGHRRGSRDPQHLLYDHHHTVAAAGDDIRARAYGPEH